MLFFISKRKNMTAWNFSSFYCEYIDFFDIESIRAIVDEVPKARLNSFAAFDYFFSLKQSTIH